MEVNTGTPAKRGRAKVKTPAVPAAEVTKTAAAPAKKTRATKKVTVSTITVATVPAATAEIKQLPSADELRGMIAMAAYYRAVERHFAPGHELDDWLAAERQINALLG